MTLTRINNDSDALDCQRLLDRTQSPAMRIELATALDVYNAEKRLNARLRGQYDLKPFDEFCIKCLMKVQPITLRNISQLWKNKGMFEDLIDFKSLKNQGLIEIEQVSETTELVWLTGDGIKLGNFMVKS